MVALRLCTVTSISQIFLSTRRQKSTGIDVEQNYATVTLCIIARTKSSAETNLRHKKNGAKWI